MMRRALDGVLLLDKPVGITSNAALQQAKRLFAAAKAGHAGTLDPLASGVLPVLLGEATKFSAFLLDAEKEYVAEIELGTSTTTGDAEGEITARSTITVDDAALQAALARFRGVSEQIPPMYSALKHQGRPLYEMARRGLVVERKARRIAIQDLELVSRSGPRVTVRIVCSKGTYVRVLAMDIGAALGTGAHLAALRRTRAGRFGIADAWTLGALAALDAEKDRALLAVDTLLDELPTVRLDADATAAFLNGRPVERSDAMPGRCRVYGVGARLLGVGEAAAHGLLRPVRLVARAEYSASG
ncbi:MAG TPA: tRNA pseudouridine(55) synthase TruB [Burkholderiales bacterium]|nr:tRNA pseudouridine(55) synthase TruB [Burkholderiales bacterium]